MVESQGRQLASKWAKTAALLGHSMLAAHIPPTRMYSADNLRAMLNTHEMVVIKPVRGAGGHGVIKVQKEGSGYSHSYYSNTSRFSSFEGLFASLASVKKKRPYLIQKGIRLATIGGRPIDYRVKYVKTDTGWVYRSMVGRLAKPGLFVTNLCRGGTMMTAAQGISRSLSSGHVASKKREMRALTVAATQVLESKFPGIGQLGFDYGIDRNGKIWIFEVNTRPQ
ncbi:YheC/YheD family protein [Paenibacillus sp. MMS18-CY102]|uniref:YheC/YheD family protein n=1 Tax=Paenibacillus sp. MMS18-CY102 TaxID=2682849 RepID=UPI0013657937|nr:YheC/YheD family protein [Paenibacillus sp. MMS18-CY102]MWC29562.1 YheC/YheD family protein [Paenibacillus sp. MMS18-CY102]